MFFTAHSRIIVLSIICALFFLSALPQVVRSQEDTREDEVVTTEEVVPVVSIAPYKTEKLLGDKVLGDFVLGPGKVELEIAPGETKTVNITVSNRIGKTHTFNFDVEDVTGSQDTSRTVILLGDDTGPYTLKDYISIPHMSFELDHNMRATIPVTISVPVDAEPGGRYGSVLVKTVTSEAVEGNAETNTIPASAVISRIGTLFFIKVPGDIETKGELKNFSTNNEQKWFQSGPVNFNILYENTGSVHLSLYGEVRINNMFGEEVGYVELDPWFSLPKSLRLREISWNREALYGRYTATVYLNRGYDDIVDEMSVTFWVIPWKILSGGLLGLFIVFFLLRGFFRKFEFKVKTK